MVSEQEGETGKGRWLVQVGGSNSTTGLDDIAHSLLGEEELDIARRTYYTYTWYFALSVRTS